MRVSIFVLLLVDLLGCALSQCSNPSNLPSQCHYNCSVLVCESSFPPNTSRLRINQCSDPLALTLTVEVSGIQFTQEYYVGGPQKVTTCNDNGAIQLQSIFSRNTTHLLIYVMGIYEGDIAIDVVPNISLPLTPHSCMCQSLEAVADSFSFHTPFFQFRYNCSRGEDCNSVMCTFPDILSESTKFMFDPCSESISVPGSNTISGQSGLGVFNQTEDRTFIVGNTTVTVHVNLTNHNFSMDFSMALSTPQFDPLQIQLFPPNKVILDRSSCVSDLTYYPGPATPVSVCSSRGTEGTPPVTFTTKATPPTTSINGPVTTTISTNGPVTTTLSTNGPVTTTLSTNGPVTTLLPHCSFMVIPPSCQLLANCSGLTCTSHFTTAVMVIDKCSDPLVVDLTITARQSSDPFYRARHYVGGPVQASYHNQISGVSMFYRRNSTHLNFTVTSVFEGDIVDLIIPDVEFPLDPHLCSCQSLNAVASKVVPPPVLQTANCTTDQNCSSIDCKIAGLTISMLFHPCHEVLILSSTRSCQQVDQVIFNQTESRPFSLKGITLTTQVTIVNHNFSMDFQLDLAYQGQSFTVVPLSQVSLDRSTCDITSLQYYPGDPTEPVIFISHDPSGGPATPLPVSLTAIAVSVPLVFVLSLVIIVTVVVCVGVALRRRKRSTNVYTFKQLTEDDDDYEADA